ncbi:MAG: TetR/AcrR family transcriptional regulator [Pseudomonadota bacterium]
MNDDDAAPKRGRPRKETRREEIIDAALAEFSENGFDRTRIEDVAKRAGVAKGTVYLYHTDKAALFEAVIRARILPTADAIDGMIDSFPGSTEQLIRAAFKLFYARISSGEFPALLRIFVTEGVRFPHLIEFYEREVISKFERLIRRIIDRAIARGEVRDGPATRLPQVLVAPAIVAALWQITFQPYNRIDVETFFEAHLDLLFGGFKA